MYFISKCLLICSYILILKTMSASNDIAEWFKQEKHKGTCIFLINWRENWHIGNNRLLNRHWKSSDLMCHLQCLKVNLINFVYRRFLVSPPWLLLRVLMLVTLSMLTDVLDYSQCAFTEDQCRGYHLLPLRLSRWHCYM